MATASFDVNKFRRDIKREFKTAAEFAINSLNINDKKQIGDAAVDEMKVLISKGVSPVAGNGRFPGYKWVTRSNLATKISRRLTGDRKKRAKEIANEAKSGRYPYSVKYKYPNKKERPVNLLLGGDFLKKLKSWPTIVGINIGFTDELSVLKESGHREGVNTQPQRPIIPQGDETINPSIYRRIVKTVIEVVKRKFKT